MKIQVGRYAVDITNADKMLFPKSKISKGELIEYYYSIAPVLLPYLKDRLLTMHRFPDGITTEGFYQKDASDYFPVWIKRKPVKRSDGQIVEYVVCQNEATIVYLANQGCIPLHIGLSKIDKLDIPDKMIFDFDPPGNDFNLVRRCAQQAKKLLDERELPSFVMTTGSRGLHVVIPLRRSVPFDQVRAYAKEIAQQLVDENPKEMTLEVRKDKRGSKLFVDYLRNSSRATAIAPYSVRALEKAPVATPLAWDELDNKKLTSQTFTIKNIFNRLEQHDPWADFSASAVSLKKYIT